MALASWMNHEESRAADMKRILAKEQNVPLFIRVEQSNPMDLIKTHNLIEKGILAKSLVKTQMGQGRGIIGGKSSSFTTPPFEYSSISSECKQPNHED